MNKTEVMNWIKKEIVLVLAGVLAFGSSLFTGVHTSHVDLNVLMLLFNLMIVVVAFTKLNVLDKGANFILAQCKSTKQLTFGLISLTFASAMLITNDVALITFVPLALILAKTAKLNPIKLIVLLTLAANLGSSMTPIGNPQNLYLYSYYELSPLEFMKMMLPLGIVSYVLLGLVVMKEKSKQLAVQLSEVRIENPMQVVAFAMLLVVILLSVFHVIDVTVTFGLTILMVILVDRSLFKKVDYSLLITFVCFFIFVGNISSIGAMSSLMTWLLESETKTYVAGILSSQVISNVPAAILLSTFTPFVKPLLIGVNIGGLGTLIASLASVISYKLFVAKHPEEGGRYLKAFTLYNLVGLVLLSVIFIFLI
ncbi:MAG: SLC13 family permease [Turicibacter sp.]